MRRILAVGLVLAAVGCAPVTGSGPAAVSNAVVETQAACVTISPALSAAAGSKNATVASVAGYANAVCGPLAAGVVPASVGSTTPTWLGVLGGMLKVLLPVAAGLL